MPAECDDCNTLLISVNSKFSELCSLSKTANPLPTVDCFLAVYEDTLKWKKTAESMATTGADEAAFWEKSATHWVEAALATELEVLKLVNNATGSIYSQLGPGNTEGLKFLCVGCRS